MSLLVQNLRKTYPTRGNELVVLRDVNLTLDPGDALAILGPSGSGKSTLLYLLGTLERATSGVYKLGDAEPFRLNDANLAAFRNHTIGFVFQDHHLLPQCSVLENVLIPTLAVGGENLELRARELLDRVGLSARLDHRPAEISGGERQRVAVARSLIHKPRLLLADEPTGNLDHANALAALSLIREACTENGAALLLVSHDREVLGAFETTASLGTLNMAAGQGGVR